MNGERGDPTYRHVAQPRDPPEATLIGAATVAVFLVAWELTSRAAFVNPIFLSSPSRIASTAAAMAASGELVRHLRVSSLELSLGYLLAAALALATRCPVILAISVRQPNGRLRLFFEPPFPLIETGDHERDIHANTQQYVRAIERYVLAHPEQYLWMLPRWRRRPDGRDWRLSIPVEVMAQERTGPPRSLTPLPTTPTWDRRAA